MNEREMLEAAEAAGAKANEFHKQLASLRERLDELVLQVAVVQAELEGGDIDAALNESQDLWRILYAVDRRFQELPE